MRNNLIGLSVGLATALAAGVANSQDAGDDWDFGQDSARKLAVAAVTFDTFGVAVRCLDGTLSVLMSGLPSGSGERLLSYGVDEPPQPSHWISGRNSTAAFALWPGSVAGELSKGGRLTVDAADGERPQRHVVDIPRSDSSVDKVFQACGRRLDANDDAPSGENFAGMRWDRPPQITFPHRSNADFALAALRCTVIASGHLRRCQIESEFPEGGGFGRAATLGAHQSARVRAISEGETLEGRQVAFLVRYNLSDPGFIIPTRLKPRSDTER